MFLAHCLYDPTLHDYCHNFHVDCPFVLSSYFQGLVLSFKMNHFEAQREFKCPIYGQFSEINYLLLKFVKQSLIHIKLQSFFP